MMIKAFDCVGKQVPLYPPSLGDQPERQVGRVAENFAGVRIDLPRRAGVVLEKAEEVVEAVLANRQLVRSQAFVVLLDVQDSSRIGVEASSVSTYRVRLKSSRPLGDFMDITMREQQALFAERLDYPMWNDYIAGCRGRDPDMPHWTDATVAPICASRSTSMTA